MQELICGLDEADPKDDELFAEWQDKLHSAIKHTQIISERNGILIEIAAQHPLIDGKIPNNEFKTRLDAGLDLYQRLCKENSEVKIYIPGSIHMDKGVCDAISLSEAGCTYLQSMGVPCEALFGDDANMEFKGDEGVYNSSDECFVATRLRDKLGYGQIHCVCSPAQLLRKALSYIEFGLLPMMHSVPCDEMFHSYVDEAFLYIPRLLEDRSGLQHDSEEAARLRLIRQPKKN